MGETGGIGDLIEFELCLKLLSGLDIGDKFKSPADGVELYFDLISVFNIFVEVLRTCLESLLS